MFVKRKLVGLLVLFSVLALIAACVPVATPQTVTVVETVIVEKEVEAEAMEEELPFEGVEVTVMTTTGPQIFEPMERRAPDFEKLTGAKINFVNFPFSDLYQKFITDAATGQNTFDVFVFAPQWMVDFIIPGYLEDLTDRVAADSDLEWDDVGIFFRDFSSTYQGRIYTIPLDGDFHMAYYRSDLLEEAGLAPPETWDDYVNIAATLHGQDMNGDGDPDFWRLHGQAA